MTHTENNSQDALRSQEGFEQMVRERRTGVPFELS
jgi:hypothetical protein